MGYGIQRSLHLKFLKTQLRGYDGPTFDSLHKGSCTVLEYGQYYCLAMKVFFYFILLDSFRICLETRHATPLSYPTI